MSDEYNPKRSRRLPIVAEYTTDKREIVTVHGPKGLGKAIIQLPSVPQASDGGDFGDHLEALGVLDDWTNLLDATEAFAASMWRAYLRAKRDAAVNRLQTVCDQLATAEAWTPEPQA